MSSILKESEYSFQLMSENDLDEIVFIEEEIYEYPWTRGIFHDCLHVGYCCRVIKLDKKIIAYSIMSVAAGEAHLLTIVVRAEAQANGYGKLMLIKMIELACTHHANTLYLEVRPSNKAAIQLYDQQGFNEVGVRNNYYPADNGREDALIMALELTTDSFIET